MNPNKIPIALVPMWFVEMMARVLRDGLKNDRKPNDWQDIPWTEEMAIEYRSSLLRHYARAEETIVPETVPMEYATVAVNAMILAYHEQNRVRVQYRMEDADMENGTGPAWVASNRVILNHTGADPEWINLHGWVSIVDTDDPRAPSRPAHYYDGPNSTACRSGPRITKGALRNLYDTPPEGSCSECLRRVTERKETDSNEMY